jgi:hypothetical protein
MTSSISRRLARLEEAACPAETLPTWVQIIVNADRGETEEEVKARYVAEHPETPPPTHWIVRKIVEWPRRSTT